MINYIWGSFIIIGLIYGFSKGISTDLVILKACSDSLELILKMLPIICLWLGIMKIYEDSGLLTKITSFISPLLKRLFPEIKDNPKCLNLIGSSIVMNFFGLGNGATGMGIKAMKEMQKENKSKDTASNSMITFLIITTSGLTLVPTTVIAIREGYNSINPTSIIIPSIIVCTISLALGLLLHFTIIKK